MGARVYDPYTGTFTQPDPIPGADASHYGYANGDPVNEIDLTGEQGEANVCYDDGNCYADGTPKSAPSWGTIARYVGTAVAGGVCVAATIGVCAGALAASTAINVTQDLRSNASGGTKAAEVTLDVASALTDGVSSWGDDLMKAADAPKLLLQAHQAVHAAVGGGFAAMNVRKR
jgi:hypothetical protein